MDQHRLCIYCIIWANAIKLVSVLLNVNSYNYIYSIHKYFN